MSSQSKTDFFHSVLGEGVHHTPDDSIPEIKISPAAYYREVAGKTTCVVIDFATWIRAIGEPDKKWCGEVADLLGKSLHKLLFRPRTRQVFVVMDKDQVLMGKGPTQYQRRESLVSLSASAKKAKVENGMSAVVREASRRQMLPATVRQSIPEGMSLEQAAREGHIASDVYQKAMKGEEIRRQCLDRHEESVQRELAAMQETAARTTLLDSDIPRNAFRHADVNLTTHNLNILEKALVAVHRTILPQPWGKTVSSHREFVLRYLTRVWTTAVEGYLCPRSGTELIFDGHRMSPDHFAVSGEEALDYPRRDYTMENTPLRFVHPSSAPTGVKEYGKNAEQVMIDNEFFLEFDPLVVSGYHAQPPPYPSVTYASEYFNEIGEADCAMYTHIKTVLEREPDASHFVEIIARDTDAFMLGLWFLYKWQHDMFQDRTSHRPLPNLVHTMGQGWCNAGTKGGAVRVTAAYRRLIKYRFGGDAHCIPDLIASVISSKSDYSFGYYFVPMEHFVKSYMSYYVLNHQDHHTPYEGPYLKRLVDIVQPVRAEDGSVLESGTLMLDGHKYRRLVNCAFFEKYRSRMTKAGYSSPAQAPLSMTRAIVNELANKKYKQYIDNPRKNPDYLDQFEQMLEALKKRLPPDEEIAKRALLVQYMLLVINQIGNKDLIEPDPALFGFAPRDESQPLTRFNIKFQASYDYEGRTEHWNRMQHRAAMLSI